MLLGLHLVHIRCSEACVDSDGSCLGTSIVQVTHVCCMHTVSCFELICIGRLLRAPPFSARVCMIDYLVALYYSLSLCLNEVQMHWITWVLFLHLEKVVFLPCWPLQTRSLISLDLRLDNLSCFTFVAFTFALKHNLLALKSFVDVQYEGPFPGQLPDWLQNTVSVC